MDDYVPWHEQDDPEPEWAISLRKLVKESVEQMITLREETMAACKEHADRLYDTNDFFRAKFTKVIQAIGALMEALDEAEIIRDGDHWNQLMQNSKRILDGEEAV